jgi:hypothetical protein
VHYADNDRAGSIDAVQRKVFAYDKRPSVWRNLRARGPKLRMFGQTLAPGDNPIDETVGRCRIVQRDMQPNIIEVGAGALRNDYAGHVSAIGCFVSRQTRASATFDIVGVQRLALAAFDALSPKPPQFFNGDLPPLANLLPCAECVTNHFARGRVLASRDGLANVRRELRCKRDAQLLDGRHEVLSSVRPSPTTCGLMSHLHGRVGGLAFCPATADRDDRNLEAGAAVARYFV